MASNDYPVELFDSFKWEKRSKIITRDIHGVSGLMNFTHFNHLTSEPSTSMHFHKGIMEIHCIIKGRSVVQLFQEGRIQTIACTGGEALVVFPGEYHARGNNDLQEPCEMLAMQLNLEERDDFLGLNAQRGLELCRQLQSMPHRLLLINTDDILLLRKAFMLFATHREAERSAGLAHLVCFLYRLLSFIPVEMPVKSTSNERIRRAIDYLSENISEPASLSILAEIAGYSLSRFKIRFREETGVTPSLFINTQKVEQAKLKLVSTEKSITEIGCDLGWSSGNYFCTVFKKLTGMSPLQYRKQFKKCEE